jgi:hypothetical protein
MAILGMLFVRGVSNLKRFIIPWAAAILVGGIICIRRRTQVLAERAFKTHKLVYTVINGFFIISNFYSGGFPWVSD